MLSKSTNVQLSASSEKQRFHPSTNTPLVLSSFLIDQMKRAGPDQVLPSAVVRYLSDEGLPKDLVQPFYERSPKRLVEMVNAAPFLDAVVDFCELHTSFPFLEKLSSMEARDHGDDLEAEPDKPTDNTTAQTSSEAQTTSVSPKKAHSNIIAIAAGVAFAAIAVIAVLFNAFQAFTGGVTVFVRTQAEVVEVFVANDTREPIDLADAALTFSIKDGGFGAYIPIGRIYGVEHATLLQADHLENTLTAKFQLSQSVQPGQRDRFGFSLPEHFGEFPVFIDGNLATYDGTLFKIIKADQ